MEIYSIKKSWNKHLDIFLVKIFSIIQKIRFPKHYFNTCFLICYFLQVQNSRFHQAVLVERYILLKR